MKRRTIRKTILLYPRSWRQRYGAELEDVAFEANTKGDRPAPGLIFDLIRGAAAQRLRAWPLQPAAATLGVLALVATVAMSASGSHGLGDVATRPRGARSATSRNADAQGTSGRSLSRAKPVGTGAPGTIMVQLDPVTGKVLAVAGAPARVIMNPQTGSVMSITHRLPGGGSA